MYLLLLNSRVVEPAYSSVVFAQLKFQVLGAKFLYFDVSILEIPLVGCCLGKLTTKLAITIFDDLVEAYCYFRQSTALNTKTADCDSLEQSLGLKLAD